MRDSTIEESESSKGVRIGIRSIGFSKKLRPRIRKPLLSEKKFVFEKVVEENPERKILTGHTTSFVSYSQLSPDALLEHSETEDQITEIDLSLLSITSDHLIQALEQTNSNYRECHEKLDSAGRKVREHTEWLKTNFR